MKILIKFILSFLFCFTLNVYAQNTINTKELPYQKVKLNGFNHQVLGSAIMTYKDMIEML